MYSELTQKTKNEIKKYRELKQHIENEKPKALCILPRNKNQTLC